MEAWPVPEGLAFNDWYFNVMLARKWEFYYVSAVLADYRVHGSNHHTKISSDGSEERSIMWLLNRIYTEEEKDPSLEEAKQRARSDVYASQYLDFATKYFGHADNRRSRRCYAAAIRRKPKLATNPQVLRRLIATLIPRPIYDGAKDALRSRRR